MIDKLVPRYLNLEDDQRLVKSVEMTDALNVRLSSDSDGDGGVIKNAYGNAAISFRTGDELPAGTNKVIGSVANSDGGEVFFFVWNSNNNHSIYRYSASSDEAQLVYRDSILDFSSFYHIRASVLLNLAGETLLYFTDANTDPKKINVTRALLGLYPASFTSGTDAEKLINIAVAKQPPMTPPTFTFSTNVNLRQNNIYDSTFQFAAQYIYQDGERSAISAYSELAVARNQFFDGIISDEQKLENNTLTVSVPTSVADVKEILVLARNGNAGAFYEIGTLVNSPSVTTQTISFDNSKLYSAISQDEVNKLYDNVPQTAEALDITGNRLMMGGYTEDYPNIRTDVDVLPNYFPNNGEYNIDVVYPAPLPGAPGTFVKSWFNVDISSIPATISEDSMLSVCFSLNLNRVHIPMYDAYIQWVQTKKLTDEDIDFAGLISNTTGVNLTASPFSVSKTINVPAGSTKNNIVTLINDSIVGFYNVIYDSDITDYDYATEITDVTAAEGTTNAFRWMFFAGSGQIEVTQQNITSNEITFQLNFRNATLTAKAGYNFNVAGLLNSGANLFGIRQLFTRGAAIGQRYPATNRLFNDIIFVDSPSLIFNGDGNPYNYFGGIDLIDGVLTPIELSTFDATATPLFGFDEATDVAIPFEAIFLTSGDIGSYGTFKSGATHSFGIVYYDKFNRNGGVQTVQDMYVDWYSDRVLDNNLKGRVDSVFRVKHNAPSWAVKWSPVYAKVNNVVNKLQYSVSQAIVASNLQATNFTGITSLQDTLFLSFRSFEGKSDSYKENFNALIDYAFQDGDRLRIVRYSESSTSSIDVEILGYFNFVEDISTNPVLSLVDDDSKFNTTGFFLAIKSVSDAGWTNYDVIQNQDNWSNECVIEIYRQNPPSTEQIFYEIGENFPVVNGIHQGERTTVSPVSVEVVADGDGLIFYSNIIVYKGDVLTASGNTLSVGNVYPQVNGIYNYVFYARIISGSFTVGSYTLNLSNSSDAVIQFSEGDSYYRPRLLKFGEEAYSNNYKFAFIEDYSVSDFFSSKSTSAGRPHAVQPDAQTVFRKGSVTYSDPFTIDSKYLGLSSFNPSLANFYDFDYQHGTIKQLVGDDDRVYIIQQRKSGWAPIGRNIIESTDGAQSLTLSRSVVGVPNYYLGDYGINDNPESLAVDRGRIYFADVRTGKIVRISRDGISLISEEFMDSFFKDNFRFITNNTSSQKVIAGVDIEADEYIVSVDAINNAVITITPDGSEILAEYTARVVGDGGVVEGSACFETAIEELLALTPSTYTVQTNAAGNQVIVGLEFDDDDLFTFSTEIREFEDICDEFEDSLNAIVFLDKIIDGQPAYVGEEYIGQSGTIYGVATNTNYDFFIPIALNISTGEFSFSNDCGNYDGIIGEPTNLDNDFTVSYDVNNNVWNTFYSYRPESIVSVDDTLFTFFAGVMYKHSDAANRATYYGNPYNAVVEVISNQNPSMVKAYESISLEGTDAWAGALSNTDQSTSISSTPVTVDGILYPYGDYEKKERNFYAYVPRDNSANTLSGSNITNLSGTSEVFVLGNVATGGVSGSTITFTTPVGDVPFPMGGSLYKVSGATLVSLSRTVSSISGDKQVTASGSITGVNNGDTIVVIGNGAIEGDQIRDYYAKIRLTNTSTSQVELYAVNAVFAKSNLHNQLGQ